MYQDQVGTGLTMAARQGAFSTLPALVAPTLERGFHYALEDFVAPASVRHVLENLGHAIKLEPASHLFERIDWRALDLPHAAALLCAADTPMVRGVVLGAICAQRAAGVPHAIPSSSCGDDAARAAIQGQLSEMAHFLARREADADDTTSQWYFDFEQLCPLSADLRDVVQTLEESPCELASGYLLGILVVRKT